MKAAPLQRKRKGYTFNKGQEKSGNGKVCLPFEEGLITTFKVKKSIKGLQRKDDSTQVKENCYVVLHKNAA